MFLTIYSYQLALARAMIIRCNVTFDCGFPNQLIQCTCEHSAGLIHKIFKLCLNWSAAACFGHGYQVQLNFLACQMGLPCSAHMVYEIYQFKYSVCIEEVDISATRPTGPS